MGFMKGQSSIEYLTTYGWMLLAVSVAAGTTFSAVDRACQKASYGFYSDSMNMETFAINRNGTVLFNLRNNVYAPIEIENISMQGEDGVYRSRATSTTIPVGEEAAVGLPGYEQFNGCNTFDVSITYNRGPLKSQTISGKIRAPYEEGDLPIPLPPTNISVTI